MQVYYDKDADLNTVLGQTVEPLPYVGMPSYPYADEQTAAGDATFQEYLREYQTRQTPAWRFWSRDSLTGGFQSQPAAR